MKLSMRLTTVASFLSKGTFFADIGTDHAYLPCYVCLHDDNARAIAGEVSEGPFHSAQDTVKKYGLKHVIDVRLGNGLEILRDAQISELVIAGMGGTLIKDILESGKKYLKTIDRIIIQPNLGEYRVRKWLINNGFTLVNEVILKENSKIYEILVADRDVDDHPYQTGFHDQQLFFGPYLLQEKSPVFIEKWFIQHKKKQHIITQMRKAKTDDKIKLHRLEMELKWIEEVLQSEEPN